MAAPAAPLAPEAGLGVAAIATALGWLVLACVLWIYRRSLGRLLIYFADKLDAIRFLRVRPLGPLASALRYVHKQTDHFLAEGMLACEKATVYLLVQMRNLLVWAVRETADLAEATAHALGMQRLVNVPDIVNALLAPLRSAIAQLRRTAIALDHQIEATFGRARRGIDALTKPVTKTLPKAIRNVGARVGRIERTYASKKWWAKHWESVLGGTVAVGIFTAALSRLGLRWLRCSNVKKAGKGICGMDSSLLEDLLFGVATFALVLNLEEFAKQMGDVVEDSAKYVTNKVT